MEQNAQQLLHAALSSYRATIEAVGVAAWQADPASGEALQESLQRLSSGLQTATSESVLSETQQTIDQELKVWSQRASDSRREKTAGMEEVLLIAGSAAQQVGERSRHYTKRFAEFSGRLDATSRLRDVTTIRESLGQHSVDLKSYVAQMAKDNESTIAQLRAQLATYEARLEEMEQIASQDPLTGLLNRRKVERHIEIRIRAAQPFSIISLDLNNFKQVNDTFGHLAGDDILRKFAGELRTVFRSSDVIGRVGGDEFAVLVDGDLSVGTSRLERINRWVNGTYAVKEGPNAPKVNVTTAAGVAQWMPGETMSDVLGRADAAMYADKRMAVSKKIHAC